MPPGASQVAVRVRPLNQREKERGCSSCLRVEPQHQQVTILKPGGGTGHEAERRFNFDYGARARREPRRRARIARRSGRAL